MIVRDLRSKVWFAIGPAQQSVERIEEDNAGMIIIMMVVNDDDDEHEDDGNTPEGDHGRPAP